MARPQSSPNCVCAQCGAAFYRRPSALAPGGGKYCSNACKYTAMRVAGQAMRTTRACAQCGTLMVLVPNQVASGRQYCSKACYHAAHTRPVEERFREKVEVDPEGCWLWTAALRSGYGALMIGTDGAGRKQFELAHRLAWQMASGEPIPPGMEILHICDVRVCVRNDDQGTCEIDGRLLPRWGHLALGTHADNLADAAAKEKWATIGDRRGQMNGRATLTDDAVREIRRLHRSVPQAELAARFHSSKSTIARVIRREAWSHVDGALGS